MALKFSLAGALADWLMKASGLCSKQLMTRTWMAIISIGPVVLRASTKRSSISGLSLIAFKTSNMRQAACSLIGPCYQGGGGSLLSDPRSSGSFR